jgi:CheY-like chemotaxis protein
MHASDHPGEDKRRPRVLLVEDNEPLRKVMARFLADAGTDVSPAGRAGEALELVAGREFDVALVDLVLPGMNGIELVRRIRELCPGLPVLMASGSAFFERAGLEELGVRRVLTKPFALADLVEAVREACPAYARPGGGEGQDAPRGRPAADGGLTGRDWRERRRRSLASDGDVPDAAEQREGGQDRGG